MSAYKDITRHRDILGEDFVGQFVVEILNTNEIGKKDFLLIRVNKEKYYIHKPKNRTWDTKELADVFIVTKTYNKTNTARLSAGKTYRHFDELCDIGLTDIYDLSNPDETKPYITAIEVMENEPDYYIVYHDKVTHRIPREFKFINPYNLEVAKNIKTYIDISNRDVKEVPILGLSFHDARIKYLELHGQSRDEVKTFKTEPKSKDKYIDYHKISNIELVSRTFQGMVLIEPIEISTAEESGKLRKYISAKINGNKIVRLRTSRDEKWDTITGKESLIVRKRIYPADDGKDLARLSIIDAVEDYKNISLTTFRDMMQHKHGTRSKMDMDVLYISGLYIAVYAEEELYKVEINSIAEKALEMIRKGNSKIRIKLNEDGDIEVYTIRLQTKLIR